MKFRSLLFFSSFFCFPISFLAFINILYSSYFDYFLNINSYTFVLFLSFLIGALFYIIGKNSDKDLKFFDKIFLIIFIYLTSSFFIALPFYLSNYQISLINSLFESASGLTGTGFTTFNNLKYMDPTLILWRSSSQWIGGLYFIIFLVLFLSSKQYNYKLLNFVFSGDFNTSSYRNIKNTVFRIFFIYSFLTLVIFFLLSFTDIRLFNSLNLSMTFISSGGFLPDENLTKIVFNNIQKLVIIFSMTIPLMNIFIFANILNTKHILEKHYEDFSILLLILALIFLALLFVNEDILDIILGVVSSLGNSGLTLMSSTKSQSLFFLILTIIGGSILSTSSGVKLLRVYILTKSASIEILKLVKPNNIFNQNILFSKHKISNESIRLSFLIFISFFISILILSSLLILDTINFENSFKLSILTLTNTVNSELFGDINGNFYNMLISTKLSLIIFMIIGKIELISIFLLLKNIFFKS